VLDRLRDALRSNWVVYAKAPFGGAENVYRYLGRYTHRVGISNARILSMDEPGVTFATKDGRTITLDGIEFLRRFLQHVLQRDSPKSVTNGLLAPCHATTTLERARALLRPATAVLLPKTTLIPDGVSPQSGSSACSRSPVSMRRSVRAAQRVESCAAPSIAPRTPRHGYIMKLPRTPRRRSHLCTASLCGAPWSVRERHGRRRDPTSHPRFVANEAEMHRATTSIDARPTRPTHRRARAAVVDSSIPA